MDDPEGKPAAVEALDPEFYWTGTEYCAQEREEKAGLCWTILALGLFVVESEGAEGVSACP